MAMVFYLFVLIVLLIVAVVVVAAWHLYLLDKKYAHIPGPPNDSVWMGCFPTVRKYSKRECVMEYFEDMRKTYGTTYKTRFVNQVLVVSIEPELVKELVASGRHRRSKINCNVFSKVFGARFLGYNSILMETDIKRAQWKRAQFNAMFHKGYFKSMTPEFNTCTEPLMRRLTEAADGKTVIKMLDEFNHITLDVLANIAFGLDINSVDSTTNPFTAAVFDSFYGVAQQNRNMFMRLDPRKYATVRKTKEAVKMLRTFGKKMIDERLSKKKNGDYVPEDILSLIVGIKENNPDFDDEELIDDFVTFFVAGQDTTAVVLSYMVLNLGKNPECFKKLQEEIDEVVGQKPVIESSDLQKLTYLDMVFRETLRLTSPASGTTRETAFDVKTKDGYVIPKGSIVYLSTYCSARYEDFFDDPFAFNPERFAPKLEKKVDTYTYFPFSLGPRTCIGRYFAETEAKIVMTKFMQRFEYQLDPTQSFESHEVITTRPRGKSAVTLTLRADFSS